MDYSILYVFLAIGIVFGVSYLVSHLRRGGILKQDDLIFAIKLLDLSLKTVSEMRLDKEKEIKNIADTIVHSLEYAISHYDTEQDVILNAYEYSLELCDVLGIDITESRKELIRELITIVFNDKYIKFVENN